MAAVKPSQSEPVDRFQRGSRGVGRAVPVSYKLDVFKDENFDPNVYVQSKCRAMSDKEIRQLRSSLQVLKKASAEEMYRSVYANLATLIRAAEEISGLEKELLPMRNLCTSQVALIPEFTEGIPFESWSVDSEGSIEDDLSFCEDREPSEAEKLFVELPDMLDVLLSERRVAEALDALDEAERIAAEAAENQTLRPAELLSLQTIINKNRQKLADHLFEAAFKSSTHGHELRSAVSSPGVVDQLAGASFQSSTRGVELHAAVSALKRLGKGPRAHSLLLNSHYERLQCNMKTIHPSSTSYGVPYTTALSQQVFSAIAQAAHDSQTVFAEDSAYVSELVKWSAKQAEAFAQLVQKHVLASCADEGSLRAAAECVQIALGHCSLLESQGILLSSVLLQHFRPSVEEALNGNLKRIERKTAALAAADDWVLIYPSKTHSPNGTSSTASGIQPKLSSSAHCFKSMVQDLLDDISPLLMSMQFAGSTLDGLFRVFDSYISLLINAIPCLVEDDTNTEGYGNKIVRMAESEEQQLVLLVNASVLAEEILPRAAIKLSSMCQAGNMDDSHKTTSDRDNHSTELRNWKRKLHHCVDRLRDSFCRQQMLALILTEDGDTLLNAQMYLSMDESFDYPEWSPSPIFQYLFRKLNTMASIAADMFVGREIFASLIMMRLLQTVVLFLSDDPNFWEDIEKGPRPLGLLGLRQFYLDMQFIIVFAQGRYLSRHAHQLIKDIIERAMLAFSATGMDPDSVLPDDDWFVRHCSRNCEYNNRKK
ncbi:hypothetical protein J5N97_011033 [Dioscorea zingiberensis]|uniref:Exocyst component Exo84 C-terminal domain-containing protein n=1 Tax=Dioscorea zingiberensis TaxID=325984 RepID=A0A9D5D293_9LILI|nr:hypothetical protein J5N97_011033 [Dioscorea zingiberensis]